MSYEEALSVLERDLQALHSTPVRDVPAYLDELLQRLRVIPVSFAPERRVAFLIDVAGQYYFDGQRVFSAVEPIAVAVMLADQIGAKALLRRAMSIQGTVLGATENLTDAISSLLRALDLAEELGEPTYQCAAWVNIGVAFVEATVYNDARIAYDRAIAAASRLPDNDTTRNLASNALHGSAVCSWKLKEYLRGLEASEEGIALLAEPRGRAQELQRVLIEATYVRLLLLLGRVDAAAERLALVTPLAERCNSARATIAVATLRGLVDVYSGRSDLGLSRINAAIEQARKVPGMLQDSLQAIVMAHEQAGSPDRAVSAHRELMMRSRRSTLEAIERHQALHLQRLSLPTPDLAGLAAMESTDAELRRKLLLVAEKQFEFLEQMAMRVELREEPKGEHAFRVASWARLLAIEAGVEPAEADRIGQAARLHDIGKLVIPDGVIMKKTALSAVERQIIETHAATGAELLARAKTPYARLAEEIARYHHEYWGGSGYPEGIAGEAIPLAARIVGIADAFDAMVHERVYRRAMSVEQALGEIARASGRQFDPKLVEAFIPLVRRVFQEHPDANAYLAGAAQAASLTTVLRSVEERAARDAAPRTLPGGIRSAPDKPA